MRSVPEEPWGFRAASSMRGCSCRKAYDGADLDGVMHQVMGGVVHAGRLNKPNGDARAGLSLNSSTLGYVYLND